MIDIDILTETVIGCAITVKRTLGEGFLENVYKNALAIELREKGLKCALESPIEIKYHNQIVGSYRADIIVEDVLIIETKCVENLSLAHEYQLVNYLRGTGIDNGLLLNFATTPLQIRRKFRNKPQE